MKAAVGDPGKAVGGWVVCLGQRHGMVHGRRGARIGNMATVEALNPKGGAGGGISTKGHAFTTSACKG